MRVERKILIPCLRLLVRPVVKFCLRFGIKLQDLLECCKAAFVDIAEEQIVKEQEQVTDSRISVMTGVHRRDVKRLREEDTKFDRQEGLLMRIVGQWRSDPQFVTKAKKPRVLTYGTEDSEFHALVGTVSRDLNPATVLFELDRVGAIEKTNKGLRLGVESYVPAGDAESGFKILANDSEDLAKAVEENVFRENEIPNLHARTEYDSIRSEHEPEIRRWFVREGHLLHQRARNFISQYDQDINPKEHFDGKLMKVILGAF